ncbi:hypothetical protein ACFSJ3_18020 [Corallincola platygyrae]|uniref:Uncharacterized protein n=1 Tax=Corallincola platygyrae TaxID=1193278 RepID=A0ABW4XUA7_9GAMM
MEWPTLDQAKIIRELATAIGIVLGGAWAFWKWSLSEYFRHRHDMPSFDGEMSWSVAPYSKNQNILSVSCVWRNVGPIALPVNTQETRFTVYKLPETSENIAINTRHGNLVVYADNKPWQHWPEAVLEPATNSQLQSHFILEKGLSYIIVCRLEAVTKPGENKQVWTRDLSWNENVEQSSE